MKVLAIETSTMLGGAAIMDDETGLIAEVRNNVKSTHSEKLMTTINYMFKQTAITISDIDVFAIAIGPGSFTGLRIGLSTVKGFSYATGNPIVSVPTLEAFAWNFPYSRYPVCPMLDARKKEVYAAVFLWDGVGFKRVVEEASLKIDTLLELINLRMQEANNSRQTGPSHEKIIFTGEGALLYKKRITEKMGEKAIFASSEKIIPSPANVAFIGLKKALKKEFSEPVGLAPFYIRKSEAEIKRDE